MTPTLRKYGVQECGWRFVLPVHSGHGSYRVHPSVPADLDIHFYDADDEVVDQFAGLPNTCGDLVNPIDPDAVRAIVVLTPSTCGGSGQGNVTATYTTIP